MIKLNKKNTKILVLIAAFLFLLFPYLRLMSNPYPFGEEPYYHLRIMENIDKNGFIFSDEYVYEGRPYIFNLAHYLFFKIYPSIIIRVVPFVLGILSAYLFFRILEKFKFKKRHNLIATLLLVSSPVFIYTFSTFNSFFIPVFLNLLGFYFIINNKYKVSLIPILSIPLFNIKVVPITLALLLVYFISKKDYKFALISSIPLFLISLIFYFIFFGFSLPRNFLFQNISQNWVSDFGAYYGFSIFLLILAVIGFYILWDKKKENLTLYIITIILFFSSLYFVFVNIFLNFFFVIFATYGLISIIKRKWESSLIKKATILLILCGLLFSTTSFLSRVIEAEPNTDQVRALKYLEPFPNEGNILSHYSNGFYIEYFSQKPVILDNKFILIDNFYEKYNDTQTIFYSRDLELTKKLLEKYDINYIWIDKKMKSGLVWDKEDQGLLFLFRNEETFKNIYSYHGVEIWKHLKN